MDWSSKLFLAFLVSVVSVPVVVIIKLIFSTNASGVSIETIKNKFDALYIIPV